mmetsp:Transcript_70129/g.196519  ORF Transcript_70129/g.196519 Transcript_70129/m.196519 type:complete len:243 (-) Transcript_70129:347-1075(-)
MLRARAGLVAQRRLRRHRQDVVVARRALYIDLPRPRRLGPQLGLAAALRRERWVRRPHQVLELGHDAVLEDGGPAQRRPAALHAQPRRHRRARSGPQRAQRFAAPAALGPRQHHEPGELLRPRRRHLCDPHRPAVLNVGVGLEGPHRPRLGRTPAAQRRRRRAPRAHGRRLGREAPGPPRRVRLDGQDIADVGHTLAGGAAGDTRGPLRRRALRGLPRPHGAQRVAGHVHQGVDSCVTTGGS